MATTPQHTPREYKAGDRLSAGDMNARGRELQRLARLTVAGGQVTGDGTGHHIVLPPSLSFVWGKITGRGTGANDNAHSWTQQRDIGDGAFEDEDNPIVGDAAATPILNPAYEITGLLADNDKIVQLWPGRTIISGSDYIQPWFFGLGGGGTSDMALVRVSSTTEDGAGYQPGYVQTYDTATNAYADSGSAILVRNANRAAETPEELSARSYLAIKIGSESGVNVYHTILGAVCVDGIFTR